MAAGTPQPVVLVFDDEVLPALDLQQDLQDFGYQVPLVTSPSEATAEVIGRWSPDVLIFGLGEGKPPGPLVEQAGRLGESLHLAVVLLAPREVAREVNRDHRVAAAACLVRPYEPPQLQAMVEITLARRRLWKQLAEMGRWFFAGVEEIGDGVFLTDTADRILYINRPGLALCGLDESELAGKALGELFTIVDDATGAPAVSPGAQAINRGRIIRFAGAIRLSRRAGKDRFIVDSAAPLHDAAGRTIGVLVVFREPGARRVSNEIEDPAGRLDGLARLLGGLARDYNSILALVQQHPELLKMQSRGPADVFAPFDSVRVALQQCYFLHSQLLNLARGDGLVYGEIDLRKATNSHLQFFHSRFPVQFDVDIPPGLWKVRGDEAELLHAMYLLLVRAREAVGEEGQMRLWYANVPAGSHELPENLRRLAGRAFVRLSVTDTRSRDTVDELPRVLEADIEAGTSPVALGLKAVLAIARQHGGQLDARAEEGRGASFQLFIPALTTKLATPERFEKFLGAPGGGGPSSRAAPPPPPPPPPPPGALKGAPVGAPRGRSGPPPGTGAGGKAQPPPAAAAPAPAAPGTPGATAAGPRRGRLRALVVDDEENVRLSAAGMLKVLGFDVEVAWDGAEGGEKVRQAADTRQPFAVAFLDLVVPFGMGAEDAAREYARLDPRLRLVVTSGYADHPVIANYGGHGFHAFIKKPFGIKEIKAVLQETGVLAAAHR